MPGAGMKTGQASRWDSLLRESKYLGKRQECCYLPASPDALCACSFTHSFIQVHLSGTAVCRIRLWAPGAHRPAGQSCCWACSGEKCLSDWRAVCPVLWWEPRAPREKGPLIQLYKIRECFLEKWELSWDLGPGSNPDPRLVCPCSLLLVLLSHLTFRICHSASSLCWSCPDLIPASPPTSSLFYF